MNPKILVAFFTGALIAAGIVYVAVRPDAPSKPATVVAANTQTPVPPPPPPAVVAQPVTVETPAAPTPTKAVREKPSPLVPPVRHEIPATIAQNREPAPQSPPAVREPVNPAPPMHEPINKERPYNDAKPADPAPEAVQFPPPPQQAPVAPAAPPPPVEDAPNPPPSSNGRTPNTVTIAAGTLLPVRIGETLSAANNERGDTFLATLDQPLVVDGFVIAERGSRVEGRVTETERTKGSSHIGIELVKISTSDGQHVRIRTAAYKKESNSSTGNDVAKVGIITAIGAAIGAAADGGKGAAIGAGVGGAAGVADVMLSRGKPVEIRVETRLSFRIQEPVTITERLN
jgi:hypothetical protein